MGFIHRLKIQFAENIVPLDETDIAAAEYYGNLKRSGSKVGLRINKGKAKTMHKNYHREVAPPKSLEAFEFVEDVQYFGTRIVLSLSDFRKQKELAWSNSWEF